MPKPNVHQRVRQIGWVSAQITGSTLNNSGTGQAHGNLGALGAGVRADSFGFQVNHGIIGGASVLYIGNSLPPSLLPSRSVQEVHDTTCLYAELFCHLRSAGNVDLPASVQFWFNELTPPASLVPAPTTFDLGDWVTGNWQEWEKWSPITVPTPPPGLSSGGAGGIRYEYRKVLGRVPANYMFMSVTNAGSVAAAEWGFGLILRDSM